MKTIRAYVLGATVPLILPGLSLAHHGPADELGGQLVHATFAPSHLGVTILVAGALIFAGRLVRAVRSRP